MNYYLAIDLGASSGRHIVGHYEGNKLILDEVFRFKNGVKKDGYYVVWDYDTIFKDIVFGIKQALKKYPDIVSLSIDTWGVDYVLLNDDKISKPYISYRDSRTDVSRKQVQEIIPFKELYEHAGIQDVAFNTIYQLYDDLKEGRIKEGTEMLMTPEYFIYLLTGKKVREYTVASTTGLVNCKTKEFDFEIIDKLGLPHSLFPKLSRPGTYVGTLKDSIVKEVGKAIKVYTCASHDTASAYEAIDSSPTSVLLSSGTWSLIGVKIPEANNSELSYQYNFTNEGGVGYIRYLKNIMGMWIVNNICKEKNISVVELIELAKQSKSEKFFDANDKSLFAPASMEEAIVDLIGEKNVSLGDLGNYIFLSLAEAYNKAIKELKEVLHINFDELIIIGGGAKNTYLNELIAKKTGLKITALPIEATAIGNIKIQRKEQE